MRFPKLAGLSLFGACLLSSQQVEGSSLNSTRKIDSVAKVANKDACDHREYFGRIFGVSAYMAEQEKSVMDTYLKHVRFAEAFIRENQINSCNDPFTYNEQTEEDFIAFVEYALGQGPETDICSRLLPQAIASIDFEFYRSDFLEAIMHRLNQENQVKTRQVVQAAVTQTCDQPHTTPEAS